MSNSPAPPGSMIFTPTDPGARAVGTAVPSGGAAADIFPESPMFPLSAVSNDRFGFWSAQSLPEVLFHP